MEHSESENEIENINLQKVIILIVSSLTSSVTAIWTWLCWRIHQFLSVAIVVLLLVLLQQLQAQVVYYMCNWSAVAGQWHWLIEKEAVLSMERNVWCWYYRHMACLDWPVQIYYNYKLRKSSRDFFKRGSIFLYSLSWAVLQAEHQWHASYHFSLLFQYLLIMCVKLLFISLLVFLCPQPLMRSFFKLLLLLKHWKVAVFPRMPTQFLSSWREKKQDCLCSVRQKNCG